MNTSAKRPNSGPARATRAPASSAAVVQTAPAGNAPPDAAPVRHHVQLQAFRAEPEGPLITVYPGEPGPGSTEPRFVANLMWAERIAAYRALAAQAGFAAVTRRLIESPPHSLLPQLPLLKRPPL